MPNRVGHRPRQTCSTDFPRIYTFRETCLSMNPSWNGPRTAVVGLVVANLVPLVGVIGFGWDLHSLLVVYWLESAVIGTAYVAKIRRTEGEDDPDELPGVKLNDKPLNSFVDKSNGKIAAYFASHYGGFWAIHGIFVFIFPFVFPEMNMASPTVIGMAFVGLAVYHVVSYRINYIGQREYERNGPVTLMIEPYRRVLVLHVTIILGAFAIAGLGVPVAALVVMVLAKTLLDLRGHLREHDRAQRRSPVPTPTD